MEATATPRKSRSRANQGADKAAADINSTGELHKAADDAAGLPANDEIGKLLGDAAAEERAAHLAKTGHELAAGCCEPVELPAVLTAGALRAALHEVADSLPVRTPQWAAGLVTIDADGVLIGRQPATGKGSRPGRKVVRLTVRGPRMCAFLVGQLGRKHTTTVSTDELAKSEDCSPFVLTYAVPSAEAQTAFAAAGITVTGPDDDGNYLVAKAAS